MSSLISPDSLMTGSSVVSISQRPDRRIRISRGDCRCDASRRSPIRALTDCGSILVRELREETGFENCKVQSVSPEVPSDSLFAHLDGSVLTESLILQRWYLTQA